MTEPRIQYARTSDGVSIAYWTIGEGPPLVHMPFPFPHAQLEWQFPQMRRWYERLAEKRKVVKYDSRGFGLSQRDVTLVEGESGLPYLGDSDVILAAIDDFLEEGEEAGHAALAEEYVHTILFTDIEGSTALTERLGDARAQELRRAHDAIVREALKGCGGSETKHTGDGIMASFPSASRAIECAVSVQRAIAERNESAEVPILVRVGLNAGEPVTEEADLFGTAVNLARRICDRAEPGQILVSDVVHQLAAGKGFTFADNGEATLKGFEKPVRLHEVRWRDG